MALFEWDAKKAEANQLKHGVAFATEAVSIFEDSEAVTIGDESDSGEQRFISIGMSEKARVIVVVYTYRGENVRIIPARPADTGERREYSGK